MENKQPTQTHIKTLNSELLLIISAEKEVTISSASNKEIIEAIEYVMTILGIVRDRKPIASEMIVIVSYLKKHTGNYTVGEIKLSFDFALQKCFPANLELFGGVLSVKFISDVLIEYSKFKRTVKLKSIKKKNEDLNNIQRLDAIAPFLSDETKELINQIGKPKSKLNGEIHRHPFYDLHQKWFRQFDALHIRYAHELDHEGKQLSGRWINRYGQIMNVEAYFNKKVEQLQLSKERNNPTL